MKISGPERFQLSFDLNSFTILCARGTSKFSGLATSSAPKLYVISDAGWPIYVGITKQSMRTRLRLGWNADGTGGYYGYAWRRELTSAVLDVWYHEDAPQPNSCIDIETIEAEVVYLIRHAGQWPKYQTEIHFHPSNDEHRTWARAVIDRFSPANTAEGATMTDILSPAVDIG
jgi:hypothetical protein